MTNEKPPGAGDVSPSRQRSSSGQRATGHCSRLDLHECHRSPVGTEFSVPSVNRQPAVPPIVADDEPANACDYLGVIFTLFAVIGVSAMYMYSSNQIQPSWTSSLRRKDPVSVDELKHQISQLTTKHQEQLAQWEEFQKRQGSFFSESGDLIGKPSCCSELRSKLEGLIAKVGEINFEAMSTELDEIKKAQLHIVEPVGTCGSPCEMNMKDLEAVVESKVKDLKCDGPISPPSDIAMVHPVVAADYDRTGMPDYALESAGGNIVSTRCTETYSQGYSVSKIFGIPIWWSRPNPREVLNPDMTPGRCWAMAGTRGSLVIRLAMPVVVTSVTYEHIPVQISVHGNIDSAPQNFSIYALRSEQDFEGALLGEFTYDKNGYPWQTFELPNIPTRPVEFVEVKILSNWGNPDYTCLYRFRVHGHLQRS